MFCFNKTIKIQIDQIKTVIVQIDHSMGYDINNVSDNAFKIIFQLKDGTNVIGCAKVIYKNNEEQKVMTILRNALPQHIFFEGDSFNN